MNVKRGQSIEIHFELLLSDSDVIRNISQTDNKCLRGDHLFLSPYLCGCVSCFISSHTHTCTCFLCSCSLALFVIPCVHETEKEQVREMGISRCERCTLYKHRQRNEAFHGTVCEANFEIVEICMCIRLCINIAHFYCHCRSCSLSLFSLSLPLIYTHTCFNVIEV